MLLFQPIDNFSLHDEWTQEINYYTTCMEKLLLSVCPKIYENFLKVSYFLWYVGNFKKAFLLYFFNAIHYSWGVVTHLEMISKYFCWYFSVFITMPFPLVPKIEVYSTTGDALPPAACLEWYRAPKSHVENVPAACRCLR